MQIQNPPIAFGIRPANGLDNIWSFWIGLLCGNVWMEVNGFTGQMGWDGMSLLANRIGLDWNGFIFSGFSPTPSVSTNPSADSAQQSTTPLPASTRVENSDREASVRPSQRKHRVLLGSSRMFPSTCATAPRFLRPFTANAARHGMAASAADPSPQPSPAVPKAVRVVVKGRVQGVFFRDWTVETARSLGLAGWVRNRRDGTVEVLLSGDPDRVDEMVSRRIPVARRPPPSPPSCPPPPTRSTPPRGSAASPPPDWRGAWFVRRLVSMTDNCGFCNRVLCRSQTRLKKKWSNA